MNYLAVDVSNLAHRYFHAIPPLSSMKTGIQTHVIMGWINFLLDHHKKLPFIPKDVELVAFFDDGGTAAGAELVEGYKENREERPDSLTDQLPFLTVATRLLGIQYVKEKGYEADHLIGQFTLTKYAEGHTVYILSSDKDMLQLVNERVFTVKPENGGTYKLMDIQAVYDRWMVYPERIPDLLVCMGDTSDNIPNVPGVGVKTAQKLLTTYGTVDGIYANLGDLKPKMREAFETHRDQVARTKQLVLFTPGEVRIRKKEMDLQGITELCRSLDMTKTLGKLMDMYS
jgi:DNA polymerase-1